MDFKITLLNHFKAISGLFLFTIIFFAIVLFVIRNEESYDGVFLVFGSFYLVAFLPTIFLHLEYLINNKHYSVKLTFREKKIIINQEKDILFKEINLIKLYMPPVWHRKGIIKFFPFEDYRYAELTMKDGKEIIFTSLLIPNLEEVIELIDGVKIEKKKRLISSIYFNRLFF